MSDQAPTRTQTTQSQTDQSGRRRFLTQVGAGSMLAMSGLPLAAAEAATPSDEAAPNPPGDDPKNPLLASSPTAQLALFMRDLSLEQIPASVVELFHTYLLDNVGVMFCGVLQPVHRYASDAMRIATGGGDTEALGGARVSLSTAAMLDGLATADFEFEHVIANAHPSSTAFPALLALAAARHCSGRDLMVSMIGAYELGNRIGAAAGVTVETQRGFHNPGLNGTLASAAGCGRLLDLDAATIASAMGLAASSSGGLLAFTDTGAMTKRLDPARCAQLGLECALLAQAGVVGPRNVLENHDGFLHAFSPSPHPELLTAGLGRDWIGTKMILKLSPVHAFALYFVYAINAYRDAGHRWSAADIDEAVVRTGAATMRQSHMELNPTSLVGAQYSVPFGIATALARDFRNPLSLDDRALADPAIRSVLGKLRFEKVTDDLSKRGGTLSLVLKGAPVELESTAYPGSPGAPRYAEAASRKYDQIMQALGLVTQGRKIRAQIERITELADVAPFRALLTETIRGYSDVRPHGRRT